MRSLTERERNLVKEAIATTRAELGNRVPTGPQDSFRNGHYKVTPREAREIRAYARKRISSGVPI